MADVLGTLRRLLPLALAATPQVGGQAVMDGVMMRNGPRLAIAVRKADGSIKVEVLPWYTLVSGAWARRPFLRGFPILVETLVNGFTALNWSAQQAVDDEAGQGDGQLSSWALTGTMLVSVLLAIGLFVAAPHLLVLGLGQLGLAGSVASLSFQLWDGVIKLLVFLAYLWAMSAIPDIRRVFAYHGAEHKAIWAYERTGQASVDAARGESRLHPRCGTAFLLYVLTTAIVVHVLLLPPLLALYTPGMAVLKQAYVVAVKLCMLVPVSAVAYEVIRLTGRYAGQGVCRLLGGPGLVLQRLTTREPADDQIEVAVAALKGAVGIRDDKQD